MRTTSRVHPALGGLAALSILAVTVPAAGAVPAPAPRVEQAWTASIGARGANGSATVRILDTGAGSVSLSVRGLRASATYAVALRAGACGKLGASLAALGMVKASAKGTAKAILPLAAERAAVLRATAVGTTRVSLAVGGGSAVRCGTLLKSLAVTPRIWFGPLPDHSFSWRPGGGAVDYDALFAPNAPWSRVAGRTHVFMLYPDTVDESVSIAQLRRTVDALKARQIRIALDWWMLEPEDGCGEGVDGFGPGPDTFIALARRIESVGGTVSYVSLANPFGAGVWYSGPNACHWSAETVARKVAAWVKRVRAAVPGVEIGLIEQYYGPAWVGYVEDWIAAYDRAVGGRLPFFHLDVDFAVPGWTDGASEIAQFVRARGTRFGLFYTSWPPATSDAEWFAGATANVQAFELDGSGPPDDAIFESWTDKPDRALPETGATTMTRLVADYLRTRTALTATVEPATTGGATAARGTVRTLGGDPVARGSVAVTVTPRDGPYQRMEFTGAVPAGATQAVIGIRVNREGAGPGTADLTYYEVGYAEGTSATNLVSNGRFEWGWEGRGDVGVLVPSDRSPGNMLRLGVSPTQDAGLESASFAVTPGARYRFWIAARVPESSIGSAYTAPIFLKEDRTEVRRDIHPLAPEPIPVGTAMPDASGAWTLTTSSMEPGRYRLLAEYAGDATYWPARARADVTVP